MAEDHYVAQTYLKHWKPPGPKAMLYGYSKAADKEFPCQTGDVCREWNWDTNPRFKDNPQLLADFRKMFEPQWNPTIGAIRAGTLSVDDRFALAGYWAQLTTCTPAWHRNAVQMYEAQLVDFIPLVVEGFAKKHPEHREAVEEALAKGRIKPRVDEDYVKAILTAHLTDATFLLYEQDWTLLVNHTDASFITSDNPSSVFPRRSIFAPLTRFLPLAPDLGVLATIDTARKRCVDPSGAIEDLRSGTLVRRNIDRKLAAHLNRVVAMNADQMVLTTHPDHHVRKLMRKHRRFGISIQQDKFQTPEGYIAGASLVVKQRGKP